MPFVPQNPDFTTSPLTGLTRRHWLDAARWLIERMFAGLPSMDGPLRFPKVPGKTYPQPGDAPDRFRSAEFEATIRSLNVVAPVLQEEPDFSVRGMRLLDYYRREVASFVLPDSPGRLPLLSDGDAPRQFTCELGGLGAILLLYPRLFEAFDDAERAGLVHYLTNYSEGPTCGHNWRYFNVMMMTFLEANGYPVNTVRRDVHLDALMALDAGEGWFRDEHFDYYNMWVFHLYAPIWSRFIGYREAPELAARMEAQSAEFMRNYPALFARTGHMPMWGRSIAYRTGAISALPACFHFQNPPPLDPGWARRICSGNLLQFVQRDDFLENGVPALGFYRHFEPCLQAYSCAASPMWGHLNFLAALSLPETHPFWTAPENDGDWTAFGHAPRELVLERPGICITNYPTSGHTELRTGKTEPDDPGYNRLAYHTAFPWEARDPDAGVAMHYSARIDAGDGAGTGFLMPVKMLWCGAEDGVLYRQTRLHGYSRGTPVAVDLADIALPHGVLRVDRPRVYFAGELRLAHYGLPHVGGVRPEVQRVTSGDAEALIARIPGRQLALVTLSGWDTSEAITHRGFNPEAEESTLLVARMAHDYFPPLTPRITLLLHRCDDTAWSEDELFPVANWRTERLGRLGVYGCEITLKDGRTFAINFDQFEGRKHD